MRNVKEWMIDEDKRRIILTVISGIALAFSFTGVFRKNVSFDLSWIAVVLSGIPIVYGAIKALITEHDIKADVLVSMALISSLYIGEYFAAGEVAFIMQIGSILEDYTAAKAKKGIEKLVDLTPRTGRVKRENNIQVIKAEDIKIGDILIVKAGETIPVDGKILSGSTSVDQSIITGESMLVDKSAGDEVISGTINKFGTFEMTALKEEKNSSLTRMINLAKNADANKAHIVSLADKWATVIVIVSFLIAVITGLLTHELIRSVTVLVVFCPCAFILATPTAVMAGICNASKNGILIRSGEGLERFSKVKYIAFDKTGTLTNGKLKVSDIKNLDPDISDKELKSLIKSAESYSEHPIAKAICEHYNKEQDIEIKNFKTYPGNGIECISNNKQLIIGKMDFLKSRGIKLEKEVLKSSQDYINKGQTIIYISVENRISGFILLSDTEREGARDIIEKLKSQNISPVLLTGDNKKAAEYIGKRVGISNIKYNLLPQDKMKIIREYNDSDNKISMVGDGINDTLALKTAYASVSMGNIGSDIAVESSDAVLVEDDLKRIPYLFKLSKKVMKKINHNIIISMTINFIAVILAILGILNPVFGALIHNCGSVFVVINSALLIRYKEIN